MPNWMALSCTNCLLGVRERELNRLFDQANCAEKGYIVPVFWVDYERTCHNSRFLTRPWVSAVVGIIVRNADEV